MIDDDPQGATGADSAHPERIIIEGPGGVKVGEGPPGGGGPIRPTGFAPSPTPTAELRRIDDVQALSDEDQPVLIDLEAVLERHGAKGRFGITLLHSHFDVANTEVLIESVDPDARTMRITTEQLTDFDTDNLQPTSWCFVGKNLVPLQYCHRPPGSVYHQI